MATQNAGLTPASCCWCGAALVKVEGAYWCSGSQVCRKRQTDYAVAGAAKKGAGRTWLFVPTPKQVNFLASPAKNRLFGGAAGPGKSHAARWGLYRKCLSIPGFEALIVRKTMPELKKSHIRKLRRERLLLGGDRVTEWNKTDSTLTFKETDAILEFGHMGDEDAVDKYLSSEYDEICADEGSTFDGEVLMELSTRARTSKPEVQAAGGAKFDVVTNPGGPGWPALRDFFIAHTPDYDRYPALKLEGKYRPEQWAYVKALLDDNPYRDVDYEDTLAVLNEARYRQLRWGEEDVFDGQFFSELRAQKDGAPYHARVVDLPRGLEWSCGMDWGFNAPGWIGFFAHLTDGHYHLRAEIKFQGQTAEQVAKRFHETRHSLGIARVGYVQGDPAMWQKTGAGRGESIAETLLRCGVPMRKGDNDRLNGWQRLHEQLRDDGAGSPYLTIDPGCKYWWRTVPNLPQDEKNPDDVDTTKEDHAGDGSRYWAMSRPRPTVFHVKRDVPVGSLQFWRDWHGKQDRSTGVNA